MVFFLLGLLVKKKINKGLFLMKQQLEKANKLHNRIEMTLFTSKEYGVWLYDHYKSLVDVLDEVDLSDEDTIDRAFEITNQGLETVEESFEQTFGMTPDEYRNQKIQMTMYDRIKNKTYPSGNFGVN